MNLQFSGGLIVGAYSKKPPEPIAKSHRQGVSRIMLNRKTIENKLAAANVDTFQLSVTHGNTITSLIATGKEANELRALTTAIQAIENEQIKRKGWDKYMAEEPLDTVEMLESKASKLCEEIYELAKQGQTDIDADTFGTIEQHLPNQESFLLG